MMMVLRRAVQVSRVMMMMMVVVGVVAVVKICALFFVWDVKKTKRSVCCLVRNV